MRILVTGATGFAGSHLVEELLASRPGVEILGVSRNLSTPAGWGDLEKKVALVHCDLCDRTAVKQLMQNRRPDAIFHLAGYAHVGRSLREPDAAWAGNLDATRNLLEAVQACGGSPRIVLVGSGLVYGGSSSGQECDEQTLLRPDSPYAVSKAAADLLGYQVGLISGLQIIRARPFNHVGPRQSPDFAVAHFAQQIVEIERGRRPPIVETGDLRPRRDLTDVRDIVRGYMTVMEKGRPGEAYNLGSGFAWSVGDVLERMLTLAGVRGEIRRRADLLRDADTPVLRANAAKVRDELGWSPRIPLDQTLADMLAYWRQMT
jgi:GDP-4-dehydro-6-deoxy-D-mannose reductase